MVIFAFAACGDGAGGGGGGGGGDVDPILTGIDVNWAALKNFGIGEPLNSAEKVWTITATFDNSTTKTLQNNIAGISWEPVDFSATAGTNKTVTVSYKGQSFQITGINVQTLKQRIDAVGTIAIATIYLYANETVESEIGIGTAKDITLKGMDQERFINNNCPGSIFNLTGNFKLTIDKNVTIKSIAESHNTAAIALGSGTFTMKEGSKIIGHRNNGGFNRGGGAVYCVASNNNYPSYFIMEGGEISGNSAVNEGGGIAVSNTYTSPSAEHVFFIISGGKIVNNISDNYADDVWIGGDLPVVKVSDKAEIGNFVLWGMSISMKPKITVASNFTGGISQLDFAIQNANLDSVETYWTTSSIPVLSPEEGNMLTKALLDRFTLGYFIQYNRPAGNPLLTRSVQDSYHFYGTKTGEIMQADFGKLVTN